MVHAIKLTQIMYYIHVKYVAESDLSEIGHQGVKFRTDLLTVSLTILIKSQFTYQSTLLSAIHLHMIMTTYLVHNHLKVSLLKSIFVTSKILILSYKISIFTFMKIVLECPQRSCFIVCISFFLFFFGNWNLNPWRLCDKKLDDTLLCLMHYLFSIFSPLCT